MTFLDNGVIVQVVFKQRILFLTFFEALFLNLSWCIFVKFKNKIVSNRSSASLVLKQSSNQKSNDS
jgi:hypothetical protein